MFDKGYCAIRQPKSDSPVAPRWPSALVPRPNCLHQGQCCNLGISSQWQQMYCALHLWPPASCCCCHPGKTEDCLSVSMLWSVIPANKVAELWGRCLPLGSSQLLIQSPGWVRSTASCSVASTRSLKSVDFPSPSVPAQRAAGPPWCHKFFCVQMQHTSSPFDSKRRQFTMLY